jgi:hypothetical protein
VKTWQKGCLAAAALLAVAGAGLAVFLPGLLREGARLAGPFSRMKRSETAFKALMEEDHWKKPEGVSVSAEQLERFLAVRQKIETALSDPQGQRPSLPRRDVRNLREFREIFEGVGGFVTAQMDAFVAGKMSPQEYHYVEEVVYQRWREGLRRAGTHPAITRRAAEEVEAEARRERDGAAARRLRAVAARLRSRVPPPPPGIDAALHALLLARFEDIERYSLDEVDGGGFLFPFQ